ncbi:MAG: hypothetical protein JWM68_2578 [Verrucomicrobiales bacterium]|nr:hypothetical protein [Verrucomicrobiales bacterium]
MTFLIVALSIIVELFALRTGFPFSPGISALFHDARTVAGMAWPVPLLWLVLLLNARSLAKLLFKNCGQKFYGTGLGLITAALTTAAMLVIVGGEHFAKNLLGFFLTSLVILVCLTPWLIKKKPVASDTRS